MCASSHQSNNYCKISWHTSLYPELVILYGISNDNIDSAGKRENFHEVVVWEIRKTLAKRVLLYN